MTHWAPAATRGRLDLDVITLRRALADGLVRSPSGTRWQLDGNEIEVFDEDDGRSRGRFAYVVRVYPDGGTSPYDALFANASDLRDFVKDMAPRSTRLLVAEHESEELLEALLRGQVH